MTVEGQRRHAFDFSPGFYCMGDLRCERRLRAPMGAVLLGCQSPVQENTIS